MNGFQQLYSGSYPVTCGQHVGITGIQLLASIQEFSLLCGNETLHSVPLLSAAECCSTLPSTSSVRTETLNQTHVCACVVIMMMAVIIIFIMFIQNMNIDIYKTIKDIESFLSGKIIVVLFQVILFCELVCG